jgi:hypothetical protein
MVEKLNLSEEQVMQITELRDGQRQKSRELRKNGRPAFDAAMQRINPDFANFGRNGGGRGGRGGNNGGAGGNNTKGGGRQQFNREDFQKAMQTVMEDPEVKAEQEKQREQTKKVDDESYTLVLKALYPRQRTTLKNMSGAPFDRALLGNPFNRFGAGAANAATAKGNGAAAKTGSDDEEEGTAAPAKTAPTAKAKAAAKKQSSLRALRGGGDDDQ